nr:hypothetical protein [Tanacetum cinerariifolium]
MVAYLNKSDASEGFNQVIDFLNGSYMKYALTVNPNIYVSYIKQFWNTVAIKQVNDVTRLQALVDKKKVVVTEAIIREVLQLDDAEGVDCLPNEEIFAELARMGYEKPSTKLTFYKAFFSSQWKFLIHTILKSMSAKRTSLNEFSSAKASAVICLSTGDDTAAYGEVSTVSQEPSIPSPTLPTPSPQPPQDLPSTSQVQHTPPQSPQAQPQTQPQPSQTADFPMSLLQEALDACAALTRRVEHLELKRVGTSQRVDTSDDVVALMDDKEEDKKEEEAKVVEDDQEDEPAEVQEVVDVVTTAKLITEVVTAANETVTAASTTISTAEPQVPAAPAKVAGKGIMVEEPKPLKKKQQLEMDEEYARKLHVELNKDIDWDVAIDHTKEHMEEEESIALQSINETPAQKAAKRRKLNEEVEDLKRHLEIVPDEDDDVYTEATPLARKVHVVDYEIINLNNKPYYKIILADGTHQLYISFLTLLKNFNREYLEALWNLVKERYTGSSLEESKEYTWSSKGQELEATAIVWCAYYNILNHTTDFVSRKKIPSFKVHKTTASRRPARMMVEYILHQAQEQDLDQAS